MVPLSVIEPGAVRTAVPCQLAVVPLGLVAEPLTVAVCVAGFQARWDCQVPVPPAAFVQAPCLFTVPFERVVVEEVVPEPPLLVVYVPFRVTSVWSVAWAGVAHARGEPAIMVAARKGKRGSVFIGAMSLWMIFVCMMRRWQVPCGLQTGSTRPRISTACR